MNTDTFEALNRDLEPRSRRLAEAPARDYTPTTPETQAMPEIPPGLIPVLAAPMSQRAKDVVGKMPEIAELQKLAVVDDEARTLAAKFNSPAARADHDAAHAAAVETGSEAAIRALPSLAERRASYQETNSRLREKIRGIHKSAMPLIETLTTAAIREILTDRAAAEADFHAVFEKHGLPRQDAAIIADPFTRSAQELTLALDSAHRGADQPLQNYLRSFGA